MVSKYLRISSIYVYVSELVDFLCVVGGDRGGQKKLSDPSKLELQVVRSHLT